MRDELRHSPKAKIKPFFDLWRTQAFEGIGTFFVRPNEKIENRNYDVGIGKKLLNRVRAFRGKTALIERLWVLKSAIIGCCRRSGTFLAFRDTATINWCVYLSSPAHHSARNYDGRVR